MLKLLQNSCVCFLVSSKVFWKQQNNKNHHQQPRNELGSGKTNCLKAKTLLHKPLSTEELWVCIKNFADPLEIPKLFREPPFLLSAFPRNFFRVRNKFTVMSLHTWHSPAIFFRVAFKFPSVLTPSLSAPGALPHLPESSLQ